MLWPALRALAYGRMKNDQVTWLLGALSLTKNVRIPAFLEAFKDKQGGLARADARRIPAVAPTLALAAKLPLWRLTAMMKRAGSSTGGHRPLDSPHTRRHPARAPPVAHRPASPLPGPVP
ncbi:hypothetical protein [Streptomyces sp. NPDC056632]|uniref:hypothetical protein n=1 Tax=Streptomyces sp. NPDC056632 TaxID=3345884 RepID=UPI003677E601